MHKKYMKIAVELAKKGKGRAEPNPLVGCVIVQNGKIVGKGRHEYFGGNHAEVNALLDAGKKAEGADLYVTLEPCNSYGKRPPCTKEIVKAGIKRVFFAVKDPNVAGSKAFLEKNGVKVYSGIYSVEAKKLLSGYLKHLKMKPKVSVKAAMTLDGKIATYKYDSKWISSEKSRDFAHKLRTRYDAVLVGTNTALKDNPLLTSHSEGKNPVRVVIDKDLKLPKNLKLFDGSVPSVVVCDEKIKNVPLSLKKEGIIMAPVNIAAAQKDFGVIIRKLNDLSLKTILIEGGGNIIASALFSNCVDDVYFFIAPKIAGGRDAVSSVEGRGVEKISDSIKVENMSVRKIGGDLLVYGRIK